MIFFDVNECPHSFGESPCGRTLTTILPERKDEGQPANTWAQKQRRKRAT